ncbi:MAG: CoA transferase [Deltaproteobacteria bacterium]|nr:CoA transferase [Deltaproteobacteria bacterium]
MNGLALTPNDLGVKGMLDGYRVLDLTNEIGPLCGKLLGDLGADVIKIEKPDGDSSRNIGPFFQDTPHPEKSLYWFAYNASKRGITLNIETLDGAKIFKNLVKTAAVVVESFKPGYLDELGLGYSELNKINPQIIMTSITPFGQTGPYSQYKGADIVNWALSGMMLLTGDPDRPPVQISHVPQSWLHGGADGAVGTAMALYRRALSGTGQHLDVSIQESLEKVAMQSHLMWSLLKREAWRGGVVKTPPSGTVTRFVWPCKDGYVLFYPFSGPMGQQATRPVVDLLERDGMADDFLSSLDWSTLDWGQTPQEEADRIEGYFARYFKTRTKEELFADAVKNRLLIQPINTAKDIMEHKQLEARGYWQKVDHPELGLKMTYPGAFIKASKTTCQARRRAPLLAEHNREIYVKELKLSTEQLTILKQSGVI